MLKTLALVLPVLLPSWRFFKTVEPSPRVEWAVFSADGKVLGAWEEFWPRPAHVTVPQMLGRLLWNAKWNDALFVMSCAERIEEAPTVHSIEEIKHRILSALAHKPRARSASKMQFRVTFVSGEGEGEEVSQAVLFVSELFDLAGGPAQ